MSWSDERVEMLRKLYFVALSASEIANELGGVTRNAVIGKNSRLGLTGRERPKSARKTPNPKHRKPKSATNAGALLTAMRASKACADGVDDRSLYEDDLQIPVSQRCSLLQLSSDKCRWPVGDPRKPDFFFCGASPVAGRSYCGRHLRRAHEEPRELRRKAA